MTQKKLKKTNNMEEVKQVIENNMEQTKELKNNMSEMTGVELEQEVKEMPKLCINDIEWEHLIKKYAFFASSGERILDDVNENNIENIFNILQEWDKSNEEDLQQWGCPYTRRVVDNTFRIELDVVYFKEEIDEYILYNLYKLTFLKENDDIKLISVSQEVDMRLSDVVSQDWKRDVYPYQNHINKLLDEAWEKNKILVEKCNNNEITWDELIHSLN